MTITLAPLSRNDGDTVSHLKVHPEQLDFVAPIEQMLGELTTGVDFHVVYSDGEAVGFFKIDRPGVSTFGFVGKNDISMRGFLIGAQHQGKGFGRAAVANLPEYLRAHYGAPRATLAVDTANPVALRTYLSGGWENNGEMHDTRAGPAQVLHLALHQTP